MKSHESTTAGTRPIVLLASLLLRGLAFAQGPAAPTGLMCELMARPELATITDPTPRFSWIVGSTGRQAADPILVASGRESLDRSQGDLWDSGKIASAQSTSVAYAGRPLPSEATCFWKVRTWSGDGGPGPFSAAQSFRTGRLDAPYQTARYPLATTAVQPVKVARKAEGHYFIDFG